ncbi:hypothetical protein [Exiguobacterium sp. s161]|uniref:hypothetical protein n=1 Tax=Exiguobacterium sp. s161 TaxID=2751191 RepID=UPI001BE90C3E|nr:hypothetical protein [Exiguobacterium sp. s161]
MKDYFSHLPQDNASRFDRQEKPRATQQTPTTMPILATPETIIISGVIDLTKEEMRCMTEYAKCREHEKTERKRIAATLRAIEYQIDAQKEVYLKELEMNYEERNRLYDMLEKTQEKALELADKELLKICYNMILNIYNNPIRSNNRFPALSDNTLKSFDSYE